MIARRSLLALLPLPACAALPPEDTTGTPIAPLLGGGFAALRADGAGGPGAVLGSAVTVAPGLVACTAHALERGADRAWLENGAAARRVRVLARSPRMDLALLSDESASLAPAPLCGQVVEVGDRVWAAGMSGSAFPAPFSTPGPGVVSGAVEIPDAILPRFGRGFTARMPARMGYSGGPVVGPDGRLRGLVAALPDGRGTEALAALSGMDLAGVIAGRERRVFILSIRPIMQEAGRLGLLA